MAEDTVFHLGEHTLERLPDGSLLLVEASGSGWVELTAEEAYRLLVTLMAWAAEAAPTDE